MLVLWCVALLYGVTWNCGDQAGLGLPSAASGWSSSKAVGMMTMTMAWVWGQCHRDHPASTIVA